MVDTLEELAIEYMAANPGSSFEGPQESIVNYGNPPSTSSEFITPLLPSTRMPSYHETTLSDADARAIYAYISTFELNAPDAEDIPALQAVLESASRQPEE